MAGKLARVRWQMGQTLLPEHFQAQEEALVTDTIMRFRMSGIPAYGIAALKWNETLIGEGVFSIQTMALVMPSGLLLDVPGNATSSPFNLNIPGTVKVPVYCHVVGETSPGEEGEGGWEAQEEGTVPRVVYQFVISSEQSQPGAFETIKLAEFEKDPEGAWQVRRDFIPPLLQVGTSPFLMSEFDEFGEALELFQYNLALDAASYLSGAGLFRVEQCLKGVYQTQRFLANLRSQVHMHPYYVYEALKSFYIEVCFYKSVVPEHIANPYRHDELATCFQEILGPLKNQMKLVEVESPYLPFRFRDGLYQIELPPEMREAKEVYLLVQKSQVSKVVSLEDIKLAGISRLPLVHRLALQGIPLEKVDQPSFQHSFGPEVDFFRIIEGEEWDHALSELSLSFYDQPQLKEMDFYIYRR
jgi:type VI secretion system protein ImpJ